MKSGQKELVKKILLTFGIMVASAALIGFALLPNTIDSRAVSDAYGRYLRSPSEETKRAYEETRDRVNRPLHILQTVSLFSGIALPFFLIRVWRKRSVS